MNEGSSTSQVLGALGWHYVITSSIVDGGDVPLILCQTSERESQCHLAFFTVPCINTDRQ